MRSNITKCPLVILQRHPGLEMLPSADESHIARKCLRGHSLLLWVGSQPVSVWWEGTKFSPPSKEDHLEIFFTTQSSLQAQDKAGLQLKHQFHVTCFPCPTGFPYPLTSFSWEHSTLAINHTPQGAAFREFSPRQKNISTCSCSSFSSSSSSPWLSSP